MRANHNLLVSLPQPPNPSAEVFALRTNWKWAYLSHFLFTFNPILHLEDIQLSELEDDLANGTFHVLPTVVQRLLICLTPHDKRSILENWQHHLRKQSIRRDPDHNLIGTEDDPVEFSSLIMTDKLNVLQSLCEWQFHNPNNLRTRMRNDDEYATWRMEPIAYDAKGNAYWLMGGSRLWLQYVPPRKRDARSHKRKQPATSTANGRGAKRGRHTNAPAPNSHTAPTKSQPANVSSQVSSTTRITRSRLAPLTPNAQSNVQKTRSMGTRLSARLRGREEEEVWQAIPEEWLKEGSSPHEGPHGTRKGNEEITKGEIVNPLDDVSELTSLSDLSDSEGTKKSSEDDSDADASEDQKPPPLPSPDIPPKEETWETVCVSLADWEAFPQRFEQSTHRGEKAFYKLLKNDLVPMITEVLRVDVRKKSMEEAVVQRKRSSRIAVKESIREAERAEARRKAEEEKEMERHRRWEARARKEEEARNRRETSRTARLRENDRDRSASMDVDVVGGSSDNKTRLKVGAPPPTHPVAATQVNQFVNGHNTGNLTPKDDELWELDCEVCHRRGMNLDDGLELMSCERCNKWQHIRCHDQADFIAGRPRRNWALVDFLCSACSAKGNPATRQPQPYGYSSQAQPFTHYMTPLSESMPLQPNQRQADRKSGQPPAKLVSKAQPSFGGESYSNGRVTYAATEQAYLTTSASQHPQHLQLSAVGNSTYPTPSPGTPAIPPYSSAPNLYLSNYGGSRPPHDVTPQTQNQSSAVYRGQIGSAPVGAWPQQQQQQPQPQYERMVAWSSAHSAVPSSSPKHGMPQVYQQHPHQNGFYRSHPVASSNPLMQQQQQRQSFTNGPTSQSS